MTEFVDDLPPTARAGQPGHAKFRADLRANVGKWAKYPRTFKDSPAAHSRANQVRREWRGYECAARGSVVYVRATPDARVF